MAAGEIFFIQIETFFRFFIPTSDIIGSQQKNYLLNLGNVRYLIRKILIPSLGKGQHVSMIAYHELIILKA